MTYSDEQLEEKVLRLQQAIETWARSKDLWLDCGFQSFSRRVDAEPRSPSVVTILHFEGPLYHVFNGTSDDGAYEQFDALLSSLGYAFELEDYVSLHVYAEDPNLSAAFDDYFHWQWVCSLIEPDCADIYDELYAYFARRPEHLHRISWREFETLLFRIFQAQGFQAELGPGRTDGGVDVRILQRDPIGDVLTLVQAKKYAPFRKIGLEAVAALHGVAAVEGAHKGILVTTSAYQPAARNFAARTSGAIELATSVDVGRWCADAAAGIIADKSRLVSADNVRKLLAEASRGRDVRVLHATDRFGGVSHRFALAIKETKHAALLMTLPRHVLSHDGYGQVGFEIPAIDERALAMLKPETVWRAKRKVSDGRVRYWDGRNLYEPWDGKPVRFDHLD